ncbi:hypothetical protein LZ32DRAFT_301706 [Colletotrichum eremochloae]|nr:hypothetical protein LZ32DRAFT_301706 [Colletotrichum eremochloae]
MSLVRLNTTETLFGAGQKSLGDTCRLFQRPEPGTSPLAVKVSKFAKYLSHETLSVQNCQRAVRSPHRTTQKERRHPLVCSSSPVLVLPPHKPSQMAQVPHWVRPSSPWERRRALKPVSTNGGAIQDAPSQQYLQEGWFGWRSFVVQAAEADVQFTRF